MGVEKDPAKARLWLQMAAPNDSYAAAQLALLNSADRP
jgi:TPR repeat protein